MEIKPFNEWILDNPGKSVNDYYKITGATNPNNQQPLYLNNTVGTSSVIEIRISASRLFLYTGMVMLSFLIWTILFLAIFYGLAGELIKHSLSKLSGQ